MILVAFFVTFQKFFNFLLKETKRERVRDNQGVGCSCHKKKKLSVIVLVLVLENSRNY